MNPIKAVQLKQLLKQQKKSYPACKVISLISYNNQLNTQIDIFYWSTGKRLKTIQLAFENLRNINYGATYCLTVMTHLQKLNIINQLKTSIRTLVKNHLGRKLVRRRIRMKLLIHEQSPTLVLISTKHIRLSAL